MRRPAKASPAGSSPTIGRAGLGLACFCLFALAAIVGGAGTAVAAENCPNALVRAQQGAQGLADCRAYEMVSPVDKNNGDVSIVAPARSSLDGNGFEYQSSAAFAGSEGAAHLNQYVARRSPTGWTTESLNVYQTPPDLFGAIFETEGLFTMSGDLSKSVLLLSHDPRDHSGNTAEDERRLYLREGKTGAITPVTPPALSPMPITHGPIYATSSTDMSRIFIDSTERLVPEAPAFVNEVYEWHNGEFSMIGVLPDGEVPSEGAIIGQGTEFGAGEELDSHSAVSADGTQVVLAMGSPRQLYLREDGETKLISASRVSGEAGTPAPDGATYMGSASKDGKKLSTIYFASPDLLTENAEGDPSGPEANELYAYDVETGELTFLTVDTEHALDSENPSSRPGARVFTKWLGASADGSYVYFFSNSMLTPDSDPSNGLFRLYMWHDGEVKYLGLPSAPPNTSTVGDGARVSADGTKLLLLSTAELAPGSPQAVKEVYLYDAVADRWSCISCAPNGPTTAPANLLKGDGLAGYFGPRTGLSYPRFLSSDGSRAFFESKGALVAGDTNGTWDVYEWHEGAVHLISSGRDPGGAHLLEASPDGHDVFIATYERLVPEDKDNLADVYDVREGGGFLYHAPAGDCAAGPCQGMSGSTGAWSPPGSALLAGTGNASARRRPARCAPARRAKRAPHRAKAAGTKRRCGGKGRRGKASRTHARAGR